MDTHQSTKEELYTYLNFNVKSFVLESATVEALHLKWLHDRKYTINVRSILSFRIMVSVKHTFVTCHSSCKVFCFNRILTTYKREMTDEASKVNSTWSKAFKLLLYCIFPSLICLGVLPAVTGCSTIMSPHTFSFFAASCCSIWDRARLVPTPMRSAQNNIQRTRKVLKIVMKTRYATKINVFFS